MKFSVPAVEHHTWVVDCYGNFVKDEDCGDAKPDLTEISCCKCGSYAIVYCDPDQVEDNGFDEKPFRFKATGGFSVASENQKELAHNGEVRGFLLPDGRQVQLVVALEVISADGDDIEYVTSEDEMGKLGMRCLDYDELVFIESEEEGE
jgi:hypothetical protein